MYHDFNVRREQHGDIRFIPKADISRNFPMKLIYEYTAQTMGAARMPLALLRTAVRHTHDIQGVLDSG